MITCPPKRGAALVLVLLLLAIMAPVCITLSYRTLHQTERMRNLQNYQQTIWYAISVESLALNILHEALKNEEYVHLAQPWVSWTDVFALPHGKAVVKLHDAQACFNLNVFADLTEPSHHSERQQLIALISRLDVSLNQAEQISENLGAFIKGNRSMQIPQEHEYSALQGASYAFTQPLVDISEIRAIQGMSTELYNKLRPLLCVLPIEHQQINVNTLDVSQSVILEALFAPWLSSTQARVLLQQRPENGWKNIEQFLGNPYFKNINEDLKKQIGDILTVSSDYFWLRSDITANEIELTMNSLIVRMDPQHFSVLWHQTGESE